MGLAQQAGAIVAMAALFAGPCAVNAEDIQTTMKVEGRVLYLDGDIGTPTPSQFRQTIERHPGVRTVVLCDMPGSADDTAMIALSRHVRSLGLHLHLTADSEIASGAVDLFLAGTARTMERGARLGVHSWSDGERDAIDYPRNSPAHAENRAYIAEMLGSDGFYWFTIEAAPFVAIHWMTEAEIDRYSILTAPAMDRPLGPDCDAVWGT